MQAQLATGRQLLVMGDDKQAGAVFAVEAEQQFYDALAGVAIQVAGRLIGQQQAGLPHECARDGHPLLFPAGELGRVMVQPGIEPDFM